MDDLQWLERWFAAQVDGTWEHQFGVKLETCDNPGWWVRIDSDKEPPRRGGDEVLESVGDPPSDANGNVGSKRWMLCRIREGRFEGAGDPTQLRNIVRCFMADVAGPVV